MPKQSNQIRGEIQDEGRRIGRDSDQFMNLIRGRINDPSSNPVYTGYQNILNRGTSPYDAMFKDFATTGGLTDENRRRIRGDGVFDEYAKTGGYSDEDKTNIRSRSNRTVPSFFEALRDQFKNQSRISGAGPSYSASLSRMGRDQSRAASEQASDTEFDIMDRVNEGRRWGAGSMSSAETGLAGLESANKRFGIGGGAANEVANRGIDLNALQGMGGEMSELFQLLLSGMNSRNQATGNNLSQRAGYDPNVSWFDRLMSIWGNINNSANSASNASNSGLF